MRNQKLVLGSFLLALVFVVSPILREAPADPPPAPKAAPAKAQEKSGLVTLYALDPLAHDFSFAKGKCGVVVEKWHTLNGGTEIDFNHYNAGDFTVGIEGHRPATIIDLGLPADLEKKYGYSEKTGGNNGFVSLHKDSGKVLILKDGKGGPFQPIVESDELFGKTKANAHAAVKLGHIYLIRITDDNDNVFERVVKLLVVSYKPDETVTIRWEVLE